MDRVVPELLDFQRQTRRMVRMVGVGTATFCSVDRRGDMSLTWPTAWRFGVSSYHSMPGHGVASQVDGSEAGGPRDW
jgi:hypothetical protein